MLSGFKFTIGTSFIISIFVFSITKSMIPPLVKLTPNCNWTGSAKSLVLLSEIVLQYPFLLIMFPCAVTALCVFLHLNERSFEKQSIVTISNTLRGILIFAIGFVIVWAVIGTFNLQEQVILCTALK